MNPQGNEWNLLYSQDMKIALQAKVHFDDPQQFGSQIYSHASSNEGSGCKSCSGQGMEEAQHDNWRKSRVKRRSFSKHKETQRKSTLLH